MDIDRQRTYKRLLVEAENTPEILLAGSQAYLTINSAKFQFDSGIVIPNGNRILLKLEHLKGHGGSGSLYDRLYPWLFSRAEKDGIIQPGRTHVVECSVGNAGASFAWVASSLGYRRYSVIMPADIYGARLQQIEQLGANLLSSPPLVGPNGYVTMLEDWVRAELGGLTIRKGHVLPFYPISKTWKVPPEPYTRLVQESIRALSAWNVREEIDCFVAGIGSGNTISMVGEELKRRKRSTRVVVFDHLEQPFVAYYVAGKKPPTYGSWSEPDFPATSLHDVPLEKLNLNLNVIDEARLVSRAQRDQGLTLLNEALGIEAGRTSGAAIAAALDMANKCADQTFLVIAFDGANKYEAEWSDRSAAVIADLTSRRPKRKVIRKELAPA